MKELQKFVVLKIPLGQLASSPPAYFFVNFFVNVNSISQVVIHSVVFLNYIRYLVDFVLIFMIIYIVD